MQDISRSLNSLQSIHRSHNSSTLSVRVALLISIDVHVLLFDIIRAKQEIYGHCQVFSKLTVTCTFLLCVPSHAEGPIRNVSVCGEGGRQKPNAVILSSPIIMIIHLRYPFTLPAG